MKCTCLRYLYNKELGIKYVRKAEVQLTLVSEFLGRLEASDVGQTPSGGLRQFYL